MNKSVLYVDAHCHLDLYPDMDSLARSSAEAQTALVAVTTTPRAWTRNRDLGRSFPNVVVPGLGLHPQLVSERAGELATWLSLLPEAKFVGEVGLDASPKFYTSFSKQKEVFGCILRACNDAGNKVLSVHSVRSATVVLDMIEQFSSPERATIILHWFTGTQSEAKRAISLGCYFSINGQMLGNPHHFKTIRELPINRILTETDGPFTRTSDRPSEPSDVKSTVRTLAATREEDEDTVRAAIITNFCRLLAL